MADAFHERMYKSQRGRYMMALRQSLETMQDHVTFALKDLDNGKLPYTDFSCQATPIDKLLGQIKAIDELKEVFDSRD